MPVAAESNWAVGYSRQTRVDEAWITKATARVEELRDQQEEEGEHYWNAWGDQRKDQQGQWGD